MPVTIVDVAKDAKVSIKTVSRVINNEPHVREALQNRVKVAMKKLGYSPNIAARRLVTQRSFSIGMFFMGRTSEYFNGIVESVLDSCTQHGYTIVLSKYVPDSADSRKQINDLIRNKHVDGLILGPPLDNDNTLMKQLISTGFPFVRFSPTDMSSPLPYVTVDDKRGAFEMTEYLIGLGHRHIGFVLGNPAHQSSHERLKGYQEALHSHQIKFENELVFQADFRFNMGVKAGKYLLEMKNRPTAIFASNDESAAGVLAAAYELGIKVPDEVSIAGFDDFQIAQRVYPSLTTVHQPMDAMGIASFNLLNDVINGNEPKTIHIKIPGSLVFRESTSFLKINNNIIK